MAKEIKKPVKKSLKKSTKKGDSFIKGVKKELAKVKWPSFKEVIKYSIATIIFIIIFVLFFEALNFIMSLVKGLFN